LSYLCQSNVSIVASTGRFNPNVWIDEQVAVVIKVLEVLATSIIGKSDFLSEDILLVNAKQFRIKFETSVIPREVFVCVCKHRENFKIPQGVSQFSYKTSLPKIKSIAKMINIHLTTLSGANNRPNR